MLLNLYQVKFNDIKETNLYLENQQFSKEVSVNENRVSSRDNLREEAPNNQKKLAKSVDKKAPKKINEDKGSNPLKKNQANHEKKRNDSDDEEFQNIKKPNKNIKKIENYEDNYDEEK